MKIILLEIKIYISNFNGKKSKKSNKKKWKIIKIKSKEE